MIKGLINQIYDLIYRPNLYKGKDPRLLKYNFKFPDNRILELEGISPRNAFEKWRYNEIIKGNFIHLNYLDVKYIGNI